MEIVISEQSTRTFQQALEALNSTGIPYVIGGAFAMYHYTDMWRNTNDLDIYLEKTVLSSAITILSDYGFNDYGEMAEGDRNWIYHATKNDVIVDLIWEPPNHVWPVDRSYVDRGHSGTFLGVPVKFMPSDELILSKLFTLNRHRSDWPDIFHVLHTCPKDIDWERMLCKLGEHWPVLLSFIVLYDWIYPDTTKCIPEAVRQELLIRKQQHVPESTSSTREVLLDPWIYTRPIY